jgi:hypothetical protein
MRTQLLNITQAREVSQRVAHLVTPREVIPGLDVFELPARAGMRAFVRAVEDYKAPVLTRNISQR